MGAGKRKRLTPEEIELKDNHKKKMQKFDAKRQHAKKIGYEWNLVFKDIQWPTHCPILGIKIEYFNNELKDNSPSFDRIDNTKGYITGNVQIISQKANRIKANLSQEEIKRLLNYLIS